MGSKDPDSAHPFWNFPHLELALCIIGCFSCFSSHFILWVGAQNYVRSRESTVAMMTVVETSTYATAIKLSCGDTNSIVQVVHVVENRNNPNAIGRVVRVVKNLKNPAWPKIPPLMDAKNSFIFLCSCNSFTFITSGNFIEIIVNPLQGVDLLRCTIILTNECHWQFNTSGRCVSILDGKLQMNGDKAMFGRTLVYGTSINT